MAVRSPTSATRQRGAGRGRSRPKVYGCEIPRLYTRPLRPLEPRSSATEQRTLGYDVIDFAAHVLGISLYPWQRWLLVHMLELLPDGSLRFRQVVVLVARQNGKSTIAMVLALWFMVVWEWPLVLGTAQDLDTAEEIWGAAVELVEDHPELAELIRRVVKVNGKKALELTNRTRWKVKAATRRGGRGLSGNLILLDELREHQNWDAWGAITHTTMAQSEALILAASNAGDITSVVLRYLRRLAHEALGDPDGIIAAEESAQAGPTEFDLDAVADLLAEDNETFDVDDLSLDELEVDEDTLGIFEWSAAPGCDRRDRYGWAQANPALNWNPGFTERNIASALKEPEWQFRTEVLCQWPDGTLSGPFPAGAWEQGRNEPVEGPDGRQTIADADRIVGQVDVGLDTSFDRSHTYVSFAGQRADGQDQVVVVAARYGQDWVRDWLMDPDRRPRIRRVTGQTRGAPVSPLLKRLDEDLAFTIPVVEQAGADLLEVFSTTFDAIRDATVRHNVQPALDLAAGTAVTRTLSADARVYDRQHSPIDAAPLVSFSAALWLLRKTPETPPPPPPPPQVLSPEADADLTGDLQSIGF